VRRQSEAATALWIDPSFIQSGVAASLCRRTPKSTYADGRDFFSDRASLTPGGHSSNKAAAISFPK
jgi:hypothetical protein